MTTLQDKLAAIQWPKDIERIGAYHVYRGKYYGTLDDGQSAETAYERDRATAAIALLEVCREWITADGDVHHEPCLKNRDVYEHPCVCGRDALIGKLDEVLSSDY